ncbi:MAG: DegQ family serine endoprotease [Desulfobacterales bacterium]|nr:DegQ family serine endoprotease [Desulfobacterales bacterium]
MHYYPVSENTTVNPRRLSMRSKSLWISIVIVALTVGLVVGAGPGISLAKKTDAIQMVPSNFSLLAKEARPAVVNIRTVKTIKGGGRVFRHFFGNPFGRENPFGQKDPFHEFFGPRGKGPQRDFKQRSLGSGFIIDKAGYIVTNNHVIEGADEITVKLSNEKEYKAKVIGRDANTDLALIRIDAKGLSALKMGDSESLEVGSWVVAIGSPFGLEQTVTAGIVSAKGRIIGSGPYDDFIQTDASINPGNSGGPLLNLNGEVVGINTAIVARGQGIGFAIPIDMAEDIISQLKTGKGVTRGWLGVGIQNLTSELKTYYKLDANTGVLVSQVFEDDPADKAGIKVGDIILKVDGKEINTSRELSRMIAGLSVGKQARITLLRDGKEITRSVQLAKREDDRQIAKSKQEKSDALGIEVTALTKETARRLGIDEGEKGVLVTEVEPGGKGDRGGIRTADVIKEINRKHVGSLKEYKKLLDKVDAGNDFSLLIRRPNAGFLVIQLEK